MANASVPLRWLNMALVLLTLLAYLAPRFDPNHFWPMAFPGLLYPWLLLANVLFIAFWAARRQWHALLSLGCVLIGWGHVRGTVGWNTPAPLPADSSAAVLRVMTFNCHGLRDPGGGSDLLPEADLAALLRDEAPDLLCLQEFPHHSKTADRYARYLLAHTSLRHYYRQDGGLAVFSRFPLTNRQSHYFENRSNGYQIVDVAAGNKKARLFNVHLQSNAVTGLANRVATRGNFQEKETWRDVRGMLGRYRRNAARRAVQAEGLAREVAASPHPVIVCGDFNDVLLSYTYRQLSAGLLDTFKERGAGLATTYAGRIPGLRIDYILVDPAFTVLRHRTSRPTFSDHRYVAGALRCP